MDCLADVELIFSLIVELAEYERAPEQVTGTPELLAEALLRNISGSFSPDMQFADNASRFAAVGSEN